MVLTTTMKIFILLYIPKEITMIILYLMVQGFVEATYGPLGQDGARS